MSRYPRRVATVVLTALTLGLVILGYGAVSHLDSASTCPSRTLRVVSKHLVARTAFAVWRVAPFVDRSIGPPTPLHNRTDYRYEDLSHPGFQKARDDPRLRLLFEDPSFNYAAAIRVMDFLRDQFPHGKPEADEDNLNLIGLLDRVDQGERFQCGSISAMLVQLFQAMGHHARRIFLYGHVVTEVWIPELEKWVMFDPDFNVHYVGDDGMPLSTLELHRMLNTNEQNRIHARSGKSRNTIYNEKSVKKLFDAYRLGFAVSFYEKWVSLNLPRWHPYRMPSISSVYYSESNEPNDLRLYYVYHAVDPAVLYAPPVSMDRHVSANRIERLGGVFGR